MRPSSTIVSMSSSPGPFSRVLPSATAAFSASARMCWVRVSETSSSIASGGAGNPAIVAARSTVIGSMPSATATAPSRISVPKTRLV